MASVLGKRKAPAAATKLKKSTTKSTSSATAPKKTKNEATKKVQEKEEEDSSFADAQEIFRRHFEAQFKPIAPEPKRKKAKVEAVEDDDDEENSEEEDLDEDVGADGEESGEEWGGLSGEEDYDSEDSEEDENPVIEVVDHTSSTPLPAPTMSKREMKAFMSSKPPSQTDSKPTTAPAPADEDDKSHLANDLALQRLLSESHLLARHTSMSANPSTGAAAKPFAEGKLRQRQIDLRAQALAPGVSSLFKQDKMPMAFRKGMNAVAAGKEAKRRKQAKENGIVLEREAPKKQKRSRADRSVDGPAVGRMKGAELRLSERDIQSIEGGGGGRGRGGGFGGGRGVGRGRGRR